MQRLYPGDFSSDGFEQERPEIPVTPGHLALQPSDRKPEQLTTSDVNRKIEVCEYAFIYVLKPLLDTRGGPLRQGLLNPRQWNWRVPNLSLRGKARAHHHSMVEGIARVLKVHGCG